MTYREMTFGDELNVSLKAEQKKSMFQAVLENQSPVMKFWFVVMVLNMLMFLFVTH